jgi:hypothetical protein
MPMAKWIEFGKHNDLKALHIKGNYNHLHAMEAAKLIRDQIINTFGVPDQTKRLLKIRIEIEKLYIKLHQGDKVAKTFIAVKEQELEKMLISKNEGNEFTYEEQVAAMIKAGITRSDSQSMSIYEYYTNIKILDKWHKKE